jgi:hypothetical protein
MRKQKMSIICLLILWLIQAVSHRVKLSERRSFVLTGTGMRTCFAPFLGLRVEYEVDASAAWGFGKHAFDHSTTDISAIFTVSTHLADPAVGSATHWVHILEVTKIWRRKSYARQGSLQTETYSPADFVSCHVWIVQTECDQLGDIMYGPEVPPAVLEFARGLASMLQLSLPLQGDFEAVIPIRTQHGISASLLTIARQRGNYQRQTKVKKIVNETTAPIHLNRGTSVPLRDELS